MAAVDLPLLKLRRRIDALPIKKDVLKGIVESAREVGIINPLRVRPMTLFENGQEAEGWEITAGYHRFEAAKELGFETVPCTIVVEDDDHAELAMLDENLKRGYNSDADRAYLSRRRKDVYERLYPETKHGGDRASRKNLQLENAPPRFTAQTAEVSGKSERVVQLDVERGRKISDQAMDRLRGTPLDKGVYLDSLKKVPRDEQVATVERDLIDPPAPTKRPPVSPAPEPRNEFESYQSWLTKLTKVFEAGSAEWRERAQDHLYPDVPVMDRGAA